MSAAPLVASAHEMAPRGRHIPRIGGAIRAVGDGVASRSRDIPVVTVVG
ncbi:hypothetical protein HQO84_25495 [Rhodococcus fascians]|nr:hypothetical protein [Rhodococcus fascians]MBY3999472.1 hypothetical protein [Rhodococcus fascians]MBY4005005.1 hypothetical protein [Rhodococcus fascians]MBY4010122.1 hypothetical protein [Rhodococcus fascians]MBY4020212.1 hypothetical protein [Rhodococcus fascians]